MRPERVVVEDNCRRCHGKGDIPVHDDRLIPVMRCPTCDGRGYHRTSISLEDFAKLFTWGQAYDEAAMRREKAPDNEIRVRPMPQGGEE